MKNALVIGVCTAFVVGAALCYFFYGNCGDDYFSMTEIFGFAQKKPFIISAITQVWCGKSVQDVRQMMLLSGILSSIAAFVFIKFKDKINI
jgi:uncharacterized membrane protein HdeD (DUF308 family)